jgi:hypothetical protein
MQARLYRGHLTIVFAALAVSRRIEVQTGWTVRKFVKTARRYRTIRIQASQHAVTVTDSRPGDLRQRHMRSVGALLGHDKRRQPRRADRLVMDDRRLRQ